MASVFLIFFSVCPAELTQEDSARLELLRQRYGALYEFERQGDVYLRAVRRKGAPDRAEAAEMYRLFWLREDGTRRDSELVYLNLYDANEQFRFQAVWSADQGRVVFTNAEHY